MRGSPLDLNGMNDLHFEQYCQVLVLKKRTIGLRKNVEFEVQKAFYAGEKYQRLEIYLSSELALSSSLSICN